MDNKELIGMNTFGFAVKAAHYAEFSTESELEAIFESQPTAWYLLGGGSNTLFTEDYKGVIIHPTGESITVITEDVSSVKISVEAGVVWDKLVEWCVCNGYAGLENLSYIPGSVGASPVQNIGAYGSEAKDRIESVRIYMPYDKCFTVLSNLECRFGYRDSVFKHELRGKAVVTEVTFLLSKIFTPNVRYGDLSKVLDGKELTLENVRNAIIGVRKSKLPEPSEIGNGGSFFKNPVITMAHFEQLKETYPNIPSYPEPNGVKVPAGWLIDTAGWKGYREGDAGVHRNQALVLVNYGFATGAEVIALAHRIIADVKEKFGVELHPEINIL